MRPRQALVSDSHSTPDPRPVRSAAGDCPPQSLRSITSDRPGYRSWRRRDQLRRRGVLMKRTAPGQVRPGPASSPARSATTPARSAATETGGSPPASKPSSASSAGSASWPAVSVGQQRLQPPREVPAAQRAPTVPGAQGNGDGRGAAPRSRETCADRHPDPRTRFARALPAVAMRAGLPLPGGDCHRV
jgi:hypothetical protein